MAACDKDDNSDTNPVVAFVSKMVAVPRDLLPEKQQQQTSMQELARR